MTSRTHLLSLLACALALTAAQLLARAPAFAAVVSPVHRSAAEAWDDAARRALMEALRERHPAVTTWDLQPLIGKRQIERLEASASATARVVRLGARSAVGLRWAGSGETTVWYAVRGEHEVIVANRDLAPGTPLEPLEAAKELRDVIALGCRALTDPARLTSMRARAPLRVGDVLCEEHIEPQPAVGRGERVTVHSHAGRVRVTATAIAEQDGAIGERLRVRAPASSTSYVARVTGRREARVDE